MCINNGTRRDEGIHCDARHIGQGGGKGRQKLMRIYLIKLNRKKKKHKYYIYANFREKSINKSKKKTIVRFNLLKPIE